MATTQAVDPRPNAPHSADPADGGQEPTTPTTDETTPRQGENRIADLDAALRELEKARKEAGKYRTENKTLRDAEDARKRDEMSEVERLKADFDAQKQANDALTERLRRTQVARAAQAKGAVDPDAVYALLDKEGVDFADDSAVDAAIDAFLAAKPYFKAQAAKVTAPKTEPLSPERTAHDRLTAGDLAKMTREQIRALPTDVMNAALARR